MYYLGIAYRERYCLKLNRLLMHLFTIAEICDKKKPYRTRFIVCIQRVVIQTARKPHRLPTPLPFLYT
jgi:hypothetical protein